MVTFCRWLSLYVTGGLEGLEGGRQGLPCMRYVDVKECDICVFEKRGGVLGHMMDKITIVRVVWPQRTPLREWASLCRHLAGDRPVCW
jgi:hypothetical protein